LRCKWAGAVTVVVSAKLILWTSRASGQTRIPSPVVHASEWKSGAVMSRSRLHNRLPWEYNVILDCSRWRPNWSNFQNPKSKKNIFRQRIDRVSGSYFILCRQKYSLHLTNGLLFEAGVTEPGCTWWAWTSSEVKIGAFFRNIIFDQNFQ